MRVLFRVDASLDIGTGHVMRCITLAQALRESSIDCVFACREFHGDLIHYIRDNGFHVEKLSTPKLLASELVASNLDPDHSSWLGCHWKVDQQATIEVINACGPFELLIVDHYGLDFRWEKGLQGYCATILVIDDLCDRKHSCDFLVDQTFGRTEAEYQDKVPPNCALITGSTYSILRPEFAHLRKESIERRRGKPISHILISMGGVDKNNITERVLNELALASLPKNIELSVVLGNQSPWLESVRSVADKIPLKTNIHVNTKKMAKLMVSADLAIGAGGATSWERCCLGLPAVLTVLAENQRLIAQALASSGAVVCLSDSHVNKPLEDLSSVVNNLVRHPDKLHRMSKSCLRITDGHGVLKILKKIGVD